MILNQMNQINLTTVFILKKICLDETCEIKFCIHNLHDVIDTHYFKMFLHHTIVIPHVSFYYYYSYSVLEPTR